VDASRIAAAQLSTPPLSAGVGREASSSAPEVPFSQHVKNALQEANLQLNEAETQARDLAQGKGDIVEAMLALSKAELSLRNVVTLRNRVMEAYQEVMRLQL
jgi:flagellar hook-basal body complex protein FliE